MPSGLWRNNDFLKLWFGHTVSQVGGLIRLLALPLTAILTLDASPFQVGLLMAAGGLPALVIGPIAGAYIDRHRRRSVLIASDWLRALVIAAVPLAYFLDSLQMWMLYMAAIAMGTLSLMFDVAYRSYLPSLVRQSELVEANSKLEFSRSAAEVAGPGIGGLIIQLAGAPVALLADAVSFAVSAVSLHWIRKPEISPRPVEDGSSLLKDAASGMRFVWRHELLRPMVMAVATVGFFNAVIEAVYLIYMTDRLELSAGLIGVIFATGSAGLLAGAALANRVVSVTGIGLALVLSLSLLVVSDLALPLAGGPLAAVIVVLVAGQIGFGAGLTVFQVAQVSLRQAVTAAALHGRMNSAFHVAMAGTVPLGALAGGLFGEVIGLRETLFIGVAGEAAAVSWLMLSPVRGVRNMPATESG